MAKDIFGYKADKADERGGLRTEPMGKKGYPKVGPRSMPNFAGPGSDAYKGDFSGPEGGKASDFGGEHG